MRFKFTLLFLLSAILGHSQVLEGRVLDNETQAPLQGATVYFDGTTIVAITDANGYFRINGGSGRDNTLAVSYVGYITFRMEKPTGYENKKLRIQLNKDETSLDEVIIGRGPFTRKQMLAIFRDQFLGTSRPAQSCKIENEDDLVLFFDVTNNTLTATARNPLKIKNSYLQYELSFDLADFSLKFDSKTLNPWHIVENYFSGTTFFKDISGNKNVTEKRLRTFMGSAPHLMRSIAGETLEADGFQIFVESFKVNPKEYFNVSDTLGIKKITLIKEPQQKQDKHILMGRISGSGAKPEIVPHAPEKSFINTLYKNKMEMQSIIDFKEKTILVDDDGNYSPVYGIVFGGYLGTLRAGDMLPRDFYQTVKTK